MGSMKSLLDFEGSNGRRRNLLSFPKISFTLSYGFVLPLLEGEEGNGCTVNGGI